MDNSQDSMAVNAEKSRRVLSVNVESSESSLEGCESVTKSVKCYTLTTSPYPVYLTLLLFFIPLGINKVTVNSIVYNKLCYNEYNVTSLCTNQTFTSGHPDLQVRVTYQLLTTSCLKKVFHFQRTFC